MSSSATTLEAGRREPRSWRGVALCATPILGFAIFFSERLFVRPTLSWVLAVLVWSVAAALAAAWLLRRGATDLLPWVDRHATTLVIGMMVTAAVVAIVVNVVQAQWFAMGMRSRDHAYYTQILWNTLQGHILAGNLNQEVLFRPPVSSDYALHVSPILLVGVLPLYALAPHFLTLLIIRDVAMAAAAWPVYLLGREKLGRPAGVAAAALFFLNPAVMAQAFQEFTPLQLAPLPFFLALLAFSRERFGGFVGWMALAMTMREDVAVTMAGFGLWALATRRPWRWSLAGFGLPVAWWGISTLAIQPAFGRWGNNISEIAIASGQRASGGHNISEIAQAGERAASWGIYQILDPTRALEVLRDGGLHYVYVMLRSVAFLPVTGLEGLLAAPVVAANLFYGAMSHEGIEPTSRLALLPSCALIGAAVLAVTRLAGAIKGDRQVVAIILLCLLPSASLLDGTKDTVQEGWTTYTLHNDRAALREALQLIPATASVAAPSYALPALANRARLFNLPQLHLYPDGNADYILIDHDLDRVTASPNLKPRYAALVERLSRSSDYQTVWQRSDYALLRRVSP